MTAAAATAAGLPRRSRQAEAGDPPLVQPLDDEASYVAYVAAFDAYRKAPGPATRTAAIEAYRRWIAIYCPDASPEGKAELLAATIRHLDKQVTEPSHAA